VGGGAEKSTWSVVTVVESEYSDAKGDGRVGMGGFEPFAGDPGEVGQTVILIQSARLSAQECGESKHAKKEWTAPGSLGQGEGSAPNTSGRALERPTGTTESGRMIDPRPI